MHEENTNHDISCLLNLRQNFSSLFFPYWCLGGKVHDIWQDWVKFYFWQRNYMKKWVVFGNFQPEFSYICLLLFNNIASLQIKS